MLDKFPVSLPHCKMTAPFAISRSFQFAYDTCKIGEVTHYKLSIDINYVKPNDILMDCSINGQHRLTTFAKNFTSIFGLRYES